MDMTQTHNLQGIVGRIIGRGGETIRALQQASQAHIVVDQNYPEGQPRRVNISGRQDAVDRAAKMVQELISGEPGSAQSIIQKVPLPASYGMLSALFMQKPPLLTQCAHFPLGAWILTALGSLSYSAEPAGRLFGLYDQGCLAGQSYGCHDACPAWVVMLAPSSMLQACAYPHSFVCAVWRWSHEGDHLPKEHGGPSDRQGRRDHQGAAEELRLQHPDRPDHRPHEGDRGRAAGPCGERSSRSHRDHQWRQPLPGPTRRRWRRRLWW